MTDQYPAWSVGRSNLQALTGKTCGLADDVLVELDPERRDAQPGQRARWPTHWVASTAEGFTANGIPADISPTR